MAKFNLTKLLIFSLLAVACAGMLVTCAPAYAAEPQIVTDERAKMLKRVEPKVSKSGFIRSPKTIPGPVYSTVIGVLDGDTVRVHAYPWPDLIIGTNLRVFGADTPEKRRHLAGCDAEVLLGKQATAFAKERIKPGDTIIIKTIFDGKFAGRVVAELYFRENGVLKTLLGELMDANLADPYFGKTKAKSWCD